MLGISSYTRGMFKVYSFMRLSWYYNKFIGLPVHVMV